MAGPLRQMNLQEKAALEGQVVEVVLVQEVQGQEGVLQLFLLLREGMLLKITTM